MNATQEAIQWTIDRYGEHTYKREELGVLLSVACEVPIEGYIVEIGTYTGCSASILLQVAQVIHAQVVLIDPFMWMWDETKEAELMGMLDRFSNWSLLRMKSSVAHEYLQRPYGIDFLHIDGNHGPDGVDEDCWNYLPWVKRGGIVAFHDYRGTNNPNVDPKMNDVIDSYVRTWEQLWHEGKFGLLIVKKP